MVDEVVVALPDEPESEPLMEWLTRYKVQWMAPAGVPVGDVLSRFYHVAKKYNASYVVRVNGDSPMILPELIDRALREMRLTHSKTTASGKVKYPITYVGYKFGNQPSVLTDYAAPEVFTFGQLSLWHSSREHITVGAYADTMPAWLDMDGKPFHTVVDTPADIEKVAFRMEGERCSS
jgi:spore coat polysaccharide biosynthesis protein SpsF